MSVQWVYNSLMDGMKIGLCLSEKDFQKQLKILKVPLDQYPTWVSGKANATVHFLETNRDRCAIVCVKPKPKGVTLIQVYGLIVHEAVHIFQQECIDIGETEPSKEFEAYSIQAISQRLMKAYADSVTSR